MSVGEAVHANGTARLVDHCGDARAFEREPRADGQSRGVAPAPARDADHAVGRLVALHAREVRTAEDADLAGHRLEHLRRRCPFRHQRRHATQRGLLVDKPPHLRPRLGVRDRRRHQLRERGEARLGIRRQGLLLAGGGGHQGPTGGPRRRSASRPPSGRPPGGCPQRVAGGIGVVVDPGRTACLEYERGEVRIPERPPAANGKALPGAGHEGDRAVGLVADHVRQVDRKQPPDLVRDRREHLLRPRPARHQRRHPPQRRLLLGQPGEPGAALGVGDRRRQQLRELGQADLGVRGHRLLLARAGGHHPHKRPSTMMGVPTAERTPVSRTAASIGPEASA